MFGLYDSGDAALEAAALLMPSLEHGVQCGKKGGRSALLVAAAVLLLAAWWLWRAFAREGERGEL